MGREARAFGLRVGLALSVALSAFGCQPARQAKPAEGLSENPLDTAFAVACAIKLYVDANGHLPDSKETLRSFCRKSSRSWAKLDWNKVSWQHPENGELTVTYTSSQGLTIPITAITPPTSVRVGDQTTMEELEKRLHQSMEK